ncbi:MAG: hypothetical protein R3D28_09050 [Geminicoccaceae bacterium]
MIGLLIAPALALAALLGATPRAVAAFDPFASAAIDDRLGARLPMRLALWDEAGREVRLGDYLADKPLLLAPVDLDCQNICGVTLGGLLDALAGLDRGPGEDFELLLVSIDQQEGPAQRPRPRPPIVSSSRRRLAPTSSPATRVLLDAIGFRYAHDPATGQFAHPAAVAVVTPKGVSPAGSMAIPSRRSICAWR